MMFGHAVFTPGQEVETHVHKTMHEVFYITKGKAIFAINNKEYTVTKGDCITIEVQANTTLKKIVLIKMWNGLILV